LNACYNCVDRHLVTSRNKAAFIWVPEPDTADTKAITAETVLLAALGSVVVRALQLGDRLCWDSLGCGDASAFSRQAAICAELREFGICARLFAGGLGVRLVPDEAVVRSEIAFKPRSLPSRVRLTRSYVVSQLSKLKTAARRDETPLA